MRVGLAVGFLLAAAFASPAQANNYPCAGAKGGVDRCSGTKFVCRDGSVSASKQKCTPSLAKDFRQQWEDDNAPEKIERDTEGPDDQGMVAPSFLLQQASTPGSVPARVIDGDTIEVAGETFRLEGIDAPEMKQHCTDANGASYLCGRRAKEALAGLIKGPVSCTVSGHDKYGRSLGYCVSGGIDLNKGMVAAGWAMAFVKYNDRYLPDERKARSAKLGLWAGRDILAPWDWRMAQFEALQPTGKCIIKGNISKGIKVYYMPFHLMYAKVKVDEAKGEKWFCSEAEAEAFGWQRANR